MYTIGSSALSAKIQEYSRTFTARLNLGDGTYVPVASLVYTHGVCAEDNISVGGGMSAMIEAFINDTEVKVFKGRIVNVEIGTTLDDGTIEYIPMGSFKIVTSNEDDMGGISITGYDKMYHEYSSLYTPTAGIGTTINNVTQDEDGNEIVTTVTVAKVIDLLKDIEQQLSTSILYPGNHVLLQSQVKVLNGYTYREMLSYLSSAMACVCYVDRFNNTRIEALMGGDPVSIGSDRYFSLNRGEDDTIITGVCGYNGEDDFIAGTGTSISVSNPILTLEAFEDMAEELIGVLYRSIDVTVLGDPRIDVNDVLSTTNTNDVTFLSPILNIIHTFDGGITTTIKAGEISADSEAGFNGSLTQQLTRVYEELLLTNEIVATKASVKQLEADYATIRSLEAVEAKIDQITATEITTEYLEANYATIESLNAVDGKFNTLDTKYATIGDLKTATADIGSLKTNVGDIQTLIFGSATGDTISVDFATAVAGSFKDGVITNAMIKNLNVEKINAGTIDTNKFTIKSTSGNLAIADNTIQIKDGTRVRIQIGKDANGDYNLTLWDANGKILWDAQGLKADAIRDGIITNEMISENTAINGSKIDISSLITEINDSNSTIKATNIYLDEKKQALNVAFQKLDESTTEHGKTIKTLQTDVTTANGKIATLITATETAQGTADSAKTQASKVEQALDGFKIAVSETYTTKSDFDNLSVGGRNLYTGTKDFSGSNWYNKGSYAVESETYNGFTVLRRPDVWQGLYQNIQVKAGETYTFSAYVKCTETAFLNVYVTSEQTPISAPGYKRIGNVGTEWTRISETFTITRDATMKLRLENSEPNSTFYICAIKVEKGNKATDWTPAPEDVDEKFANYTTTTEMKALIKVNADAIALRVEKNGIVSAINQTSETIKIDASKINLAGYVTVSALETAGSTTINGSNIKTGVIQSSNYVSGSTGTKINLSDGTIDTKGFKVDSKGIASINGATLTDVNLKFTADGENMGAISLDTASAGMPKLSLSATYGMTIRSNRGISLDGGSGGVSLGDAGANNVDVTGTTNTKYLRITSTHDASETSTGHGLQIGPDDSYNMRIDPNELVILNNGALSPLYINGSYCNINGNMTATGNVVANGGDVRVINGSNYASVGKGASDAYLHNTASGKYLQLKDSGELQYSGTNIILASNYTATKSANGYVKLPNGIIIQWGNRTMTCTTGGTTVNATVTFPVKFSSACYAVMTDVMTSVPEKCSSGAGDYTTSNFKMYFNRTNTTGTGVRWVAVGV